MLGFDPLETNVPALPAPPAPPATAFGDTVDPADYIPQGMTADARVQMRQAAQLVSGALAWPLLGRMRPDAARASTHMSHFLTGAGADMAPSPEEADDLATSSEDPSDYEKSFLGFLLDNMNHDFQGRDVLFQQYISRNSNPASENEDTPWIGMSSAMGTSRTNWYFAIGAFWMCYIFLAERQGTQVIITYRRHIFDRYNWHNDLNTGLPALLGKGIPPEILTALAGTMSAGADDLPILFMGDDNGVEKLIVDDSLFGSLIEDGEAHPYNVSGSGVIMRISFPWTR